MNNPIKGVIQVTGEHDTGKTLFALSCGAEPKKIGFIDDDIKGRATVEQIGVDKFGFYCDFVRSTIGLRELQIHEYGLETIERMRQKDLDVVIWDTWTRFARTCHPYVVRNAPKFKEFWSPMGEIKGAEQWIAAFQYEAQLIEKLLDAAPLVILITHLKPHRIGKAKTGKEIPDSQKTLEEKCNMRIWLRHNPSSPAPIGLVLKRIAKIEVDESGIHPINVLPRKINPCTWNRIVEYWNQPIGDRAPLASEVPNEYELSILDGTLTADQKLIFQAEQKAVEMELPLEEVQSDPAPKTVMQLIGQLSKRGISLEKFQEVIGYDAFETKEKDVADVWQKMQSL